MAACCDVDEPRRRSWNSHLSQIFTPHEGESEAVHCASLLVGDTDSSFCYRRPPSGFGDCTYFDPLYVASNAQEVIKNTQPKDFAAQDRQVSPLTTRRHEGSLKPAPTCDASALLTAGALADVMMHWSWLGARPQRLTLFHCRSIPNVSISVYLNRLVRYYCCSEPCIVLCLIYIDRVQKHHPDRIVVSFWSVHRLMTTALALAAKFHDDHYFPNAYYAKVGGIPLRDFNAAEVHFLNLLQWRLLVNADEYDQYKTGLAQSAGHGVGASA